MFDECMKSCPRIQQAAQDAGEGLALGAGLKFAGMLPYTWPITVIGHDRLTAGMGKVNQVLMPTTPDHRPINPTAATDLVEHCARAHACTGPRPSAREEVLPFSRTRRAFGYPHTTTVPTTRCGADTTRPVPSRPCPITCPDIAAVAAAVDATLTELADQKGLAELVGGFLLRRLDKAALAEVHRLAETPGDVTELSAAARRLAERSQKFSQVSVGLLKVVRVLNLAKSGLEVAQYIRLITRFNDLMRRLADSPECAGPAQGLCSQRAQAA